MVAALPEERLLLESDQHAALWKTACCHFGLEHASPDRQTDRQRNARPKPRTTIGAVWRTDTELPVPKLAVL